MVTVSGLNINITEVLAAMSVVVFTAAFIINLYWLWHNRKREYGLIIFPLVLCLLSAWFALGYTLVLISGIDSQMNIILLRPATLITGVVFIAIPSFLLTVRDSIGHAAEIQEVLANARQCREELQAINRRLEDVQQLAETYKTAYTLIKERRDKDE